jgi:DNA-binding response OmpR family regulator
MMKKTVILIVEDDPVLLRILCKIVEMGGYEPVGAQNAKAALKQIKETPPELILEDIVLPDLNGVELIQCIRRIEGYETIPVIFLSASQERIETAKFTDKINDEYFLKPLKPSQLLMVINEMLSASSSLQNLKQ